MRPAVGRFGGIRRLSPNGNKETRAERCGSAPNRADLCGPPFGSRRTHVVQARCRHYQTSGTPAFGAASCQSKCLRASGLEELVNYRARSAMFGNCCPFVVG